MLVEPSIAVLRPKLPATSQPQSLGKTPLTPAVPCHVSVSWKNWRGPGSARRRLRSTMSSPVGLVGLVAGIAKFNRVPGETEEHTSELQSLMRISYAVFCLKKKNDSIVFIYNQNNSYNSY